MLTKNEVIEALNAFTNRADWRRLILVAAAELAEREFCGQVDAILMDRVQQYCSLEQIAEAGARVMVLSTKARDASAARIERAQKNRSAERAFPVAATPKPAPKIEAVARHPGSRKLAIYCRAPGCNQIATHGAYCAACRFDA